ncbi:hypothetical protein CEXT_321361, partial [Caerostris extrusa]
SNSGSYSRKFTKDVHCQTYLVTEAKDASTSTYDLESFVDAHGDEEADLLDEAMVLQSPNFIPEVNLNPFTNPFYELLSVDDPFWLTYSGQKSWTERALAQMDLGVHIIPTCDNDVCDDIILNCDNDVCNDIILNSDNDVYGDIILNWDNDLKQWSNLKDCDIYRHL